MPGSLTGFKIPRFFKKETEDRITINKPYQRADNGGGFEVIVRSAGGGPRSRVCQIKISARDDQKIDGLFRLDGASPLMTRVEALRAKLVSDEITRCRALSKSEAKKRYAYSTTTMFELSMLNGHSAGAFVGCEKVAARLSTSFLIRAAGKDVGVLAYGAKVYFVDGGAR
ncbi:hypothetical protein [Pacificoceanicola onchidii]|uniref:hypothetical protein n=1 Tax=Pacificoceanicola onchidii TaxID=2562685 RepID=UPI0010A56C94|nr:hypothetical protein [Pacificoceanicola onchidii]